MYRILLLERSHHRGNLRGHPSLKRTSRATKRGLLALMVFLVTSLGTGCEIENPRPAQAQPTNTMVEDRTSITVFVPLGSADISERAISTLDWSGLPYQVHMVEGSNNAGVKGLSDGVIDIMVLMREPFPEEDIAYLEILQAPIVVFVHPDLGITDLTHDQVRDLYAGVVTNWSQIGGPDVPVKLFSQEIDDPATDLMRVHYGIEFPGMAEVVYSEFSIFTLVGGVSGAIGYGGWAGKKYVELTSPEELVDPVTLNGQSPEDPDYPLLSHIGLAYLPGSEDYLTAFIDLTMTFVQSSALVPILDMFGIYLSPEIQNAVGGSVS